MAKSKAHLLNFLDGCYMSSYRDYRMMRKKCLMVCNYFTFVPVKILLIMLGGGLYDTENF